MNGWVIRICSPKFIPRLLKTKSSCGVIQNAIYVAGADCEMAGTYVDGGDKTLQTLGKLLGYVNQTGNIRTSNSVSNNMGFPCYTTR